MSGCKSQMVLRSGLSLVLALVSALVSALVTEYRSESALRYP